MALQHGNFQAAKALFEAGGYVPEECDCTQILTSGVLTGSVDLVSHLLRGQDVNFGSYPAIHAAADIGNAEIIAILCENGADVDAHDEKNV